MKVGLHPARWWEPAGHEKLLCTLCPRYCTIGEGQYGFCYIRKNIDNKLITLGYGRPSGFGLDPIEKKPLYHFHPGSRILSFGTAGCNLGCKFCQNWHISKVKEMYQDEEYYSPEAIITLSRQNDIPAIAFTYNDPVIFGEYVIDIAELARQAKINTVMVTAGYIDKTARKEVFANIDAANVDLKAFTEDFYHALTYSHLNDVLDTLVWLKRETDVWLEITTLLIPGKNDSAEDLKKMCNWIVTQLGTDVPLHFTAFHPDFQMRDLQPTPLATLVQARTIAISEGINYCYIGNVFHQEGHTTFCPKCSNALIIRDYYSIIKNELRQQHNCPHCGTEISGIF